MSLKEECHLLVLNRLAGRYQIEDLPEEDNTLLNIQTQEKFSLQSDICYYHEKNIVADTKQLKNIVQTLLDFMINTLLKI